MPSCESSVAQKRDKDEIEEATREEKSNHILLRNALGDAHDQGNFGLDSFKNGLGSCAHLQRSVRACQFIYSFFHARFTLFILAKIAQRRKPTQRRRHENGSRIHTHGYTQIFFGKRVSVVHQIKEARGCSVALEFGNPHVGIWKPIRLCAPEQRALSGLTLLGLLDSGPHRQVQVRGTGLARAGAADDLGAVLDGLLGVEGALLAREALEEDLGVLVYPDAGSAGGSLEDKRGGGGGLDEGGTGAGEHRGRMEGDWMGG